MSEQLQLRRGAASQVAAFTGAQGEVVVDTTNNRAVVNDGVTVGGWPAAKLAEVVTNARTAVSDAAYSAQTIDRTIAFTALTAARIVTLPPASAFPTGTRLAVFDETGNCSATLTITLARAGSDVIDGATSAVISSAYGYLALQSNGAAKWTVVDQANSSLGPVGIGTAADPNNPLSVYGAAALFNGPTNMNVTVNKNGSGNTASFIFEDSFSGRAQVGLNGSDNFSFKVSPNGSAWTTAIAIDATTGAATLANQRTAVSDAAYAALVTNRLIAYTALTATRALTLPAASAYPAGQALTVADESGACSATKTIIVSRAGSDTINGAASVVLATGYGYVALESNGSNAWTIIDTSALVTGDSGSGGAAGLVPPPPSGSAAASKVLGAGGVWVSHAVSVNQQLFTASGTYTPTSGAFAIHVRAVGAGGGGGGAAATSSGQVSAAGGGGAGAYAEGVLASPSSQTVTIGSSGSGGSTAGGTGGNGGTTSFGALVVAGGGVGGQGGGPGSGAVQADAGSGGSASAGQVQIGGGAGTPSFGCSATGFGGNGGSSVFGGGARGPSTFARSNPGNAGAFGSGGSGASVGASSSGALGGAGGAGFVIVTEFILTT